MDNIIDKLDKKRQIGQESTPIFELLIVRALIIEIIFSVVYFDEFYTNLELAKFVYNSRFLIRWRIFLHCLNSQEEFSQAYLFMNWSKIKDKQMINILHAFIKNTHENFSQNGSLFYYSYFFREKNKEKYTSLELVLSLVKEVIFLCHIISSSFL